HARTLFAKALYTLAGSVRFFLFANQEAVDKKLRDVYRFRPGRRACLYDLGGEKSNTGNDWIGALRHSTSRARLPLFAWNHVIKHAASEAHAFRVQSSCA